MKKTRIDTAKRILILACAASFSLAIPAAAFERYPQRGHVQVERHDRSDAQIAAGLIGFTLGAVIGSTIDEPVVVRHRHGPRFQNHRRHEFQHPRRHRATQAVRPWTSRWYRQCANIYRSFDARTGTYRTYGGERRFCVIR